MASGADNRAEVLCMALDAGDAIAAVLRLFDPDVSRQQLTYRTHCVIHSDAVFFDSPRLALALRALVPPQRSGWLAPDIERHLQARRRQLWRSETARRAAPAVRCAALGAGVGVTICTPLGGSAGLLLGTAAGASVGLIPAWCTLGLSVPAGAAAGGAVGVLAGAGAGAATGSAGGAFVGCLAYNWPKLKARATLLAGSLRALVKGFAQPQGDAERLQVAVTAGAGGAILLGSSGGTIGLLAGSALGASCGVVPAVFTFGLSIPAGAVLGGGVGLCAGTGAGATVGLVWGGAVGYHISSRQDVDKLVLRASTGET